MSSPLNRKNRRTAPYVIVNNHTQPPSVAYSARQPEQTNNQENGIQTLTNTPLQQTDQDEVNIATTSLYDLVRRAQVC